MADQSNGQTALGRKLQTARKAKGWSRETLARKSGTASLTILRAEIHGSEPTLASLTAWALALDVPLTELLTHEPSGDAA